MLFHTWPFALFFAVTYAVYLALRRTRFWLYWLLVTSYFFYGWWNPLFLILIVYSTALDYVAVVYMSRGRHRKLWLWFSLVNNLGLLGFFKYADFVTDNLNALLTSTGVGYALPRPDIVLPVGISFFTFQSMSYTIDYYRGGVDREPSFVRFATFVAFFPQLVAGPIERARDLLPQFHRLRAIKLADVTDGLSLFVVGLFKKVALANYLAIYVDRVYAAPAQQSGPALAAATFAFAWQIYFDFSGYTDMARGVAKAMGFDLMLNFNNPYTATSIRDFWSRWHISLSTWFRDYVYVPLGGNRRGGAALARNLLITFVVSGFWHGAAWTFVIWGALHGIAAVVMRPMERSAWYRDRVPRLVKQLGLFLFVCLTWVFFRAETLADAGVILRRILTTGWADPGFPMLALSLVLGVWGYELLYESRARGVLTAAPVRIAIVVAMILYLFVAPGTPDRPFIYFQF
jgi:alginate O-acetyltransferase complex protein AlgI